MKYLSDYKSPLGAITLASDGENLTGLWFAGQKYYGAGLEPDARRCEVPVFIQTRRWLDLYFQGLEPDFTPALKPLGTDFRLLVWDILREIPRGSVLSYGAVAALCAQRMGIRSMSAQAVGGAVGHNPISIIIPCHRVTGSDGSLTGYAGGTEKKLRLLELEKAELTFRY